MMQYNVIMIPCAIHCTTKAYLLLFQLNSFDSTFLNLKLLKFKLLLNQF